MCQCAEEFLRWGSTLASKGGTRDVQNIFHKMEQRTLRAAYKFYCDKDSKERTALLYAGHGGGLSRNSSYESRTTSTVEDTVGLCRPT